MLFPRVGTLPKIVTIAMRLAAGSTPLISAKNISYRGTHVVGIQIEKPTAFFARCWREKFRSGCFAIRTFRGGPRVGEWTFCRVVAVGRGSFYRQLGHDFSPPRYTSPTGDYSLFYHRDTRSYLSVCVSSRFLSLAPIPLPYGTAALPDRYIIPSSDRFLTRFASWQLFRAALKGEVSGSHCCHPHARRCGDGEKFSRRRCISRRSETGDGERGTFVSRLSADARSDGPALAVRASISRRRTDEKARLVVGIFLSTGAF